VSAAKRGRPREYDYVEIKVRIKVPVDVHACPKEFDSAYEYFDSFGVGSDDKISVTVNGRRCRFTKASA